MKKKRFKRDDWIALGLAELSAKGPEAVKLEAICTAAGLTRGSFYHHFEDHERFLTALATDWVTTQTTQVAAAMDQTASAQDQGAALTDAAMAIDYRLELGIRELARRLPQVAEIVRAADATRLSVIAGLYADRYGLEPERAESLAYLEYAAFSGMILLDPAMPEDRQHALAALFDSVVSKALKPS